MISLNPYSDDGKSALSWSPCYRLREINQAAQAPTGFESQEFSLQHPHSYYPTPPPLRIFEGLSSICHPGKGLSDQGCTPARSWMKGQLLPERREWPAQLGLGAQALDSGRSLGPRTDSAPMQLCELGQVDFPVRALLPQLFRMC